MRPWGRLQEQDCKGTYTPKRSGHLKHGPAAIEWLKGPVTESKLGTGLWDGRSGKAFEEVIFKVLPKAEDNGQSLRQRDWPR